MCAGSFSSECWQFSTWWQHAGHAGQRLSVNATAILLAEAQYFDDEKVKAVECTVAHASQKRPAGGQL
jgi:hypothetical protein